MIEKAENFSIVCGTAACNASCPFCVSKMTGIEQIGQKPREINWRNFGIAARLAKELKVGSVVITGKGEPTLFPNQVTEYLKYLQKYDFPLIDLQTNALMFEKRPEEYDGHLKRWYDLGLGYVAISIVSNQSGLNRLVYSPKDKQYIDLPKIVAKLHGIGFSTRFSVTMFNGGVDKYEKVAEMVNWTRDLGVAQLTLRKIAKPRLSENTEVGVWTEKHFLTETQNREVKRYLDENGTVILEGGHGSLIYDVRGQNVCLTNALTCTPDRTKIRQVIFFPDGRIQHDWQYAGARIL